MSYCPAIRTLESDSRILIDACLARVRVDARLDEEPVLPPLESILPNRLIVRAETDNVPTADAIVKSVWSRRASPPPSESGEVPVAPPPAPAPSSAATGSTQRKARSLPVPRRWPVLLCGFLSGIFGGVALMKSPVGRQPAVQHTVQHSVTFAKRQAGHVYAAVSSVAVLHGK